VKYHSDTLKLIGVEPQKSDDSGEALAQVEARIRRPLPASVREWYELEDACEILRAYSNADPPLEIADLGKVDKYTDGEGPHDLLSRHLLLFKRENQGVCAWAIHLNGTDDPPVVVDVDTQFRSWVPCADSFSQYVYSCVWDHSQVIQNTYSEDLLLQAQNRPLSKEALEFLRVHFQAELVTYGWPGEMQYRFLNGDQRILIWANPKQADWQIVADSEQSLARLVALVAPLDSLAKSLWSHAAEGQALLKRILV
jgi:hypothetical protein